MPDFPYPYIEGQQPEVHLALLLGTTDVAYPWQAVMGSLAQVQGVIFLAVLTTRGATQL